MGLSLPKSNLIFLKKCLDKWVHFTFSNKNDGSGYVGIIKKQELCTDD